MYVMGTSELTWLPSKPVLNPLSNVKKTHAIENILVHGGGEHDNDNGPRSTNVSLLLCYLYGNLSIQVNETTVIRESRRNSSTVVNFVSLLSYNSVLFKTVSVGHPPLQMLLCGKQVGRYELTKLNIHNSSCDNRQETAGFTSYITVKV